MLDNRDRIDLRIKDEDREEIDGYDDLKHEVKKKKKHEVKSLWKCNKVDVIPSEYWCIRNGT